jgi:hypothetical protein
MRTEISGMRSARHALHAPYVERIRAPYNAAMTHPAIADPEDTSDEAVLSATRVWLERAVIGQNLCPFAKAVHVKAQIRWVVSQATDVEGLLDDLFTELKLLAAADPQQTDTTLLIHPHVLGDFLEYNDFLELADAAVAELDLEGELQVASFHPDYQFAETPANDISHATNRSPYPTLHLLREASIDRAVAAYPEADELVERNIATLKRLGVDGWRRLFADHPLSALQSADSI